MTISDWRKSFKQLREKPVILQKYKKHNAKKERITGRTTKRCRQCGRYDGHISKYKLDLCRCCFREIAIKIGFKKYN